jgi:hypothetical protein
VLAPSAELFEAALRNAEEFFMGDGKVQRALDALAKTLGAVS